MQTEPRPAARHFSAGLLALAVLVLASPAPAEHGLGHWTELTPMPWTNAEWGGDSLDGMVYLVGGFAEESGLFIYDPADDSWSRGADIPVGTHHPAVLGYEGLLYVIGGHESENMVQIYDPATDSWSRGADLPTPRRAMAIVELKGLIHVIGGTDDPMGGGGHDEHEVYDPAADRWTTAAPLLEPREHGYAAVIGGRIYYAAGRVGAFTPMKELQIYDPKSDGWSYGAPLPEETSGHVVRAVKGQLYAIGGERVFKGEVLDATQHYDPVTDRWDLLTPAPRPIHATGNAVVGGSIYLFGGAFVVEGSSNGTDTVYRFDPPEAPERIAPRRLRAKLLASGRVRLRWKFPARRSDATSLEIQMKAGKRFKRIASPDPEVKKLVLAKLEPGEYVFRIRSKGPSGPSAWSNERALTVPE